MTSPTRIEFHSARATTAPAGSVTAAGVSGTSPGPLSTPSRNSHSEGTSTSHRPKKQAMASGGIRLRAASAQPASTATARPPATALTTPAVTRVVDNTSGETTSQPPTARRALSGQEWWRPAVPAGREPLGCCIFITFSLGCWALLE